ncbi:hypothetical protein FKM82_026607 [Ascaphus truei]
MKLISWSFDILLSFIKPFCWQLETSRLFPSFHKALTKPFLPPPPPVLFNSFRIEGGFFDISQEIPLPQKHCHNVVCIKRRV